MNEPAPLALVSRPESQKQSVVRILEEMLEAARRGEYASVMAVAEEAGTNSLVWCWSGHDDLPDLAAKLDLLKHQTYRRLFGDTPLAR